MKLSKLFVALVSVVAICMFTGCNNAGGSVVCEDNPMSIRQLTPPDDNWWIYEFPYDCFPDEISFTTEYATYAPDSETITAHLTNVATNPRYILSRHLLGFCVVRETDYGWRRVPLEGHLYLDMPVFQTVGDSNSYTIINDCYNFEQPRATGNLYTHGYRFTPGGTYRILTYVSLFRTDIAYPGYTSGGEWQVWGDLDFVWSGPVWAEFFIEN